MIKLIYLIPLLLLASCNKDVTIIGGKKTSRWHVPFTLELNKMPAFSDGTSQAIIKLQLFDSNNQSLVGAYPTATPQDKSVTAISCTQTDSSGITYCKFTSTTNGSFAVDVTDTIKTYTTNVLFFPLSVKLDVVRVTNSPILKQETNGYIVTTGQRKTQWLRNTPGGTKVDTESPVFKLNLTEPYPY